MSAITWQPSDPVVVIKVQVLLQLKGPIEGQ